MFIYIESKYEPIIENAYLVSTYTNGPDGFNRKIEAMIKDGYTLKGDLVPDEQGNVCQMLVKYKVEK